MRFYQWRGAEKYAGYVGATPSDDRKICWFEPTIGDPLPALGNWVPARLTQYLGEGPKFRKPRPIGDAPRSSLVNLIGSRAAESLRDVWDRDALLYPVLLDDASGQTHFMVVVTAVMGWDCVDETKTEYGIGGDGKVYALKRWGFHADRVGDHDLFVLPHNSTAYFVTQRFVDRVLAAKLKGFQFDSVYLDFKPLVS